MTIILSICFGIMIYFSVTLAFYRKGACTDAMKRRIDTVINADKIGVKDEELSQPLMERFVKPLIKKQLQLLSRFTPNFINKSKKQEKSAREKRLQAMLYRAGLSTSVSEFRLIRLAVIAFTDLLLIIIALICRAQIGIILLTALFGIYTGFSITRFYLTAVSSKRKKSMERQLPDVLDLLSVSVEAGLGFEQGINQIISHFEGPLIDELAVTYREMSMGRTRRDALILLGDRCDLEEIKSFVGALVQASQLGISIKNVLRAQASAMRQDRKNKIEEKAMKISVKILIPMVIFIFPVIFIVLLGPAVISIMNVLR